MMVRCVKATPREVAFASYHYKFMAYLCAPKLQHIFQIFTCSRLGGWLPRCIITWNIIRVFFASRRFFDGKRWCAILVSSSRHPYVVQLFIWVSIGTWTEAACCCDFCGRVACDLQQLYRRQLANWLGSPWLLRRLQRHLLSGGCLASGYVFLFVCHRRYDDILPIMADGSSLRCNNLLNSPTLISSVHCKGVTHITICLLALQLGIARRNAVQNFSVDLFHINLTIGSCKFYLTTRLPKWLSRCSCLARYGRFCCIMTIRKTTHSSKQGCQSGKLLLQREPQRISLIGIISSTLIT